MLKIVQSSQCCGCGACAQSCPRGCIQMKADAAGFLYPVIDQTSCIDCGLCEKACPMLNVNSEKDEVVLDAMAAQANDPLIRENSSSGGVFAVIAERVIAKGGIVFGAGFDENFIVVHRSAEDLGQLQQMMGSKYVQSDTGDSFRQVKDQLRKGRRVLYSGTPCQIAGLKSYLQQPYKNLLTIDLLCHGVPSPKVWKLYLQSRPENNIEEIKFRDKRFGWKNWSMSMVSSSGKRVLKHQEDPYVQMFLKNIDLRDACHCCKFKSINRCSDLTLGDAWGIHTVMPELDDDRGTSLVFVHSQQGVDLLVEIKDRLRYSSDRQEELLSLAADACQSVSMHDKRSTFFRKLEQPDVTFDQLVKTMKKNIIEKVYWRVKKFI